MKIWDTARKSILLSIGELVTFKGDGALTEEITAVFSDEFLMIDPETAQKVTNSEPHILVNLDDLSREPVLGDVFEIRSTEFSVGYMERDGEGGAKLFLREVLS